VSLSSISFCCHVVAKAHMSFVVAEIIDILQSFGMTKCISFGCQVVAKAYKPFVVAGIIDILQSFGMTKRLEHSLKSLFHDGDTVSVIYRYPVLLQESLTSCSPLG
jgi:hypothetical protein